MDCPWYECIVVGCGGIGSGTLYWLAKRLGPSVLGLEQFKLGHDNGGSQDHSRTIRMDYTDKDYIELCRGSYAAWAEVETESGLKLVYVTGGVLFAENTREGGRLIDGIEKAMKDNGIQCERIDGELLNKKFPQFTRNPNCKAIYLPDNGVVDAALANAVNIQLARKHGATIVEEVKVTGISRSKEGALLVHTTFGDYRCRRLIVTAGAWANGVLRSVGVQLPLSVTKEQVTYFATPYIKDFTKERFPVWTYYSPEGKAFYGLPIHGNSGSKIGMDAEGERVTAETRTFTPNQDIVDKCLQMCRTHIPRYLGPILRTKTCLYAMTPDRHFVIDTCHRFGFPDVILCCGAGHAFKFASVLGKILTDLATEGQTSFNIEPFTLDRSALTDRNYKPNVALGTWSKLNQSQSGSKL